MHMGRLWDTARAGRGGYSLSALSEVLLENPKVSMKDIFGRKQLKKDGEAVRSLPPRRRCDHFLLVGSFCVGRQLRFVVRSIAAHAHASRDGFCRVIAV